MTEDTLVALWESRGGKTRVELYQTPLGFRYRASGREGIWGAGGYLAATTTAEAIAELEPRVGDFQPDRNKTPMKRVK